jgi:hypothetical protein
VPGLTNVTFGEGCIPTGERRSAKCRTLTAVTIGDSLFSIGMYVIARCALLVSVRLPPSLRPIGDGDLAGAVRSSPSRSRTAAKWTATRSEAANRKGLSSDIVVTL